MTAKVLTMLLGAACASSWWALATVVPPDTLFPLVCVFSTLAALIVLFAESLNVNT